MLKIFSFFKTYKLYFLVTFLSLIYFLVTVFDSYSDVLNPDSINWHNRTYFFMQGINEGKFSKTYQAYHPGISLMWVMGIGAYSDLSYFSKDTFQLKDFQAKVSIYITLTILFLASLLILKDFIKTSSLVLFSIFYTFEPFILGIRRLVHLEALMTGFILLSFLLLFKYSRHTSNFKYLILSALFFILGFYTKSSAIITLPALFLLFLISKDNFKKKLLGFFVTIVSMVLFLYLLFPALWNNPIIKGQEYFTKIYEGASLIGYEGRREVGTSGTAENLILKKSYTREDYFYSNALLYVSTPTIIVLFIISLFLITPAFLITYRINPLKKIFTKILDSRNFYLALFSLLIFACFFTAYSISTKSYERYAYVFYPFLLLLIVSIYNLLEEKFILIISTIYLTITIYELSKIHPYYYSYGNSYLGGSFARYEKLNSPSFGVAIYELDKKLSEYILENEKEYFPVIAGSKTLKAIFSEGRNERYPLCDVDYFIQFYDDKTPSEVCIGRSHSHLFTISVGNMEYWKVYKFNRQSSKAKKLSEINKANQTEVKPEIDNTEE